MFPGFEYDVGLSPVLVPPVKLEQPLVLLGLLLGIVGVDVPHAEGLSEVLEREVGPHPDRDLASEPTNNHPNKNIALGYLQDFCCTFWW